MIRTLIAALTALVLTTLPAAAQKLSLGEVSQYLNSIQSAKGQFTQINGDGSISTGTISIKRPGKVRFEYNPPDQALVLAWAGAGLCLRQEAGWPARDLPAESDAAVDHPGAEREPRPRRHGDRAQLRWHRHHSDRAGPGAPDRGSIQMKFTGQPVQLRQWVITDGNGSKTTVVLGALDNASLPNSVFDVNRVK